jgi:hypothetical protein
MSTFPRCHLDQRERSQAAIIRPKKGILDTTRFLASLRNDRGGVISSFALPGTARFLAVARNDREKSRNDRGRSKRQEKKSRNDREEGANTITFSTAAA